MSAGSAGALVCGLIDAEENPLFDDTNGNGIDDAFEKQKSGALLGANSSSTTRMAFAQQWQQDQKDHPPKGFNVRRPRPDGALASPDKNK